MRLHREGYPTLAIVSATGIVMSIGVFAITQHGLVRAVAVLAALLAVGFFAWFFRNPERVTPDNGMVYSPADGTVVAIEHVHENEYFHTERLKISIYMSPLNVHLNRVPFTGEVRYTKYHPGKYLLAFHPKASELNERNTVVFADGTGREVLVRQIAGFLARRIVSYMTVEQHVMAGQELGFIKFGSRCDVFVPVDAAVLVTLNERVRGGETAIARFS